MCIRWRGGDGQDDVVDVYSYSVALVECYATVSGIKRGGRLVGIDGNEW